MHKHFHVWLHVGFTDPSSAPHIHTSCTLTNELPFPVPDRIWLWSHGPAILVSLINFEGGICSVFRNKSLISRCLVGMLDWTDCADMSTKMQNPPASISVLKMELMATCKMESLRARHSMKNLFCILWNNLGQGTAPSQYQWCRNSHWA